MGGCFSRRTRTASHAPPTVRAFGRSVVSEQAVAAFVNGLLDDSATNLPFVPDAIERHLEQRTLLLLLNALAHGLASAQIEFMGHKVEMRLVPVADGNPVPGPEGSGTRTPTRVQAPQTARSGGERGEDADPDADQMVYSEYSEEDYHNVTPCQFDVDRLPM